MRSIGTAGRTDEVTPSADLVTFRVGFFKRFISEHFAESLAAHGFEVLQVSCATKTLKPIARAAFKGMFFYKHF